MANAIAIDGGTPVRKDFLVFGAPRIEQEDIDAVVDTLRSGWLSTGPRVQQFEDSFKQYVCAKYAIAVNSCTAALHLALLAAGIGPGDEVITTPLTFAATANVIQHVGARPVFADIDRSTQCIDPLEVMKRITPKTKAVIPVHMTGRACDLEGILAITNTRGIKVVEDAAHAIETVARGRKVGSIGDFTAFSFYVNKNICTGEGGMLTTNDESAAEFAKIASLHGLSKHAWKRFSQSGTATYETLFPGYKYNMMDIQAALGLSQMKRVSEYHATRERIWQQYDAAFAGLPAFTPAPVEQWSVHARHLYTLMLDLDRLSVGRERIIDALKAENIGTGIHYTALHLHKHYRDAFGYKRGDYPCAEWVSDRTLSLPLSPKLADADVTDVIAAVRKVLLQYQK